MAEPAPELRADREAPEVPGDVLAEVSDAAVLPEVAASSWACRRSTAVTVPSVGAAGGAAALKAASSSANSHGSAEAAPADHDAVGAGLGGHGQRVRGAEDVAVAEHGQPAGSASRSRAMASQSAWPE